MDELISYEILEQWMDELISNEILEQWSNKCMDREVNNWSDRIMKY